MSLYRDLSVFDTVLPADCVEFYGKPLHDGRLLLALGTYKLEDSGAQRTGRIYLLAVEPLSGSHVVLQTIEEKAVLDIKWCGDSLAVANSDGLVKVYRLDAGDSAEATLNMEGTLGTEPAAIACATGWSADSARLVSCHVDGHLRIYDSVASVLVQEWRAHEMEIWSAAFDKHDPNLLFSTSDDYTAKIWDIRQPVNGVLPLSVLTSHQMGVTSVDSHPRREFVFATGSYDRRILLWDRRKLDSPAQRVPPFHKEILVGGGAWRIKWDPDILASPDQTEYILAACMQDGFQVINTAPRGLEGPDFSISGKRPSESLAYGCDWAPITRCRTDRLIASCSFYNSQMQLWTFAEGNPT